MAGRVKHAQRSHKTSNKNYNAFRRHTVRAYSKTSGSRIRSSILERMLNFFSRGDR